MFDLFPMVVFALVVVLLLVVWERLKLRAFERKWPPLSDEEFVARCSPGTNPERALRVRRIISEQLGVPYERIYPEQRFVEDLDCC